MPPGLGKRPVAIGQPGFPVPGTAPRTTLEVEGALLPLTAAHRSGAGPAPAGRFKPSWRRSSTSRASTQAIDPGADPLLAPPLYGRWHAARATVTPRRRAWLDELNLDPRHRSVAALGTRVIQEHQEALMASAWEQAADLSRSISACASCR